MHGAEIYRLARKRQLMSIRDNGHIYTSPKKDKQWAIWTKLDKLGVKRIQAIVDILRSDGWLVLG